MTTRHEFKTKGQKLGAKQSHAGTDHFGAKPFHTEGHGCWMHVPETGQQPKEQRPPTLKTPLRQHHQMARETIKPYGKF